MGSLKGCLPACVAVVSGKRKKTKKNKKLYALGTILNVDSNPLTSFIVDARYERYEKRASEYFKAFLKRALCAHLMRRYTFNFLRNANRFLSESSRKSL